MSRELLKLHSENENQLKNTLLPYGFLMFLERIGLLQAVETTRPYPQTITLDKLHKAHDKGPREVQKIKINYINELISHRVSPPHSLGTAMKARAQQLLQSFHGYLDQNIYGDPGTWLLDPLDDASCNSVAEYLLETGRTDFWMSGAMTGDFTDHLSKHKNQRMPIFGHEYDPFSQKSHPARNIEDIQMYLKSIKQFIQLERIEKLSRRLALIKNPDLEKLKTREQLEYIALFSESATTKIEEINEDPTGWDELNTYLIEHGQKPLDQHDHALIKIFPQDNPNWQSGDLRIENGILSVEFSAKQFTHRENNGMLENKPLFRFEITKTEDGKPLIVGDYQSIKHLDYLAPLINSKKFWKGFDKHILPLLGASPYHQIEFMYELPYSPKRLNKKNLKSIMGRGKTAFIIDIISGIHQSNSVAADQKYKSEEKNGTHNQIAPLLEGIDTNTWNGIVIHTLTEHELNLSGDYRGALRDLLYKTVPARTKRYGNNSQNFTVYDQETAIALLRTYNSWNNNGYIPTNVKEVLRDIAKYGKTNRPVSELIEIIEDQAFIAQYPDGFENLPEWEMYSNWLFQKAIRYIHPLLNQLKH